MNELAWKWGNDTLAATSQSYCDTVVDTPDPNKHR